MKFETVVGAEQMLQARARRRDADALLQRRQRVLRQSGPVVADFHSQLVAVAAGGDVDVAGPGFFRDSVFDRVLDQGLQNQVRH